MQSFHMCTSTLSNSIFRFHSEAKLRYSTILRLQSNQCKLVRIGLKKGQLVRRNTTGLVGLTSGVSAAAVSGPDFLVITANANRCDFAHQSNIVITPVEALEP